MFSNVASILYRHILEQVFEYIRTWGAFHRATPPTLSVTLDRVDPASSQGHWDH